MANEVNWARVEIDYIKDPTQTFETLSEKYDVNYKTIASQALKGTWVEKRKTFQEKLSSKILEKAMKTIADKAEAWNNSDVIAFGGVRDMCIRMMNQMNQIIIDDDGNPILGKDGKPQYKEVDPKKLRAVSAALLSAQRGARLALGMTTENIGSSDPYDALFDEEEKALASVVFGNEQSI